jgi:hypothetical protein
MQAREGALSSETQRPVGEIAVDLDNLYREESFTDLKVASIQCLTPIKPDGSPDESREKLFMGQTQLMSQAGPVPVHFPIPAKSLAEAMEKFPEGVNQAVDRLIAEAKEIQREEASRIIVPGTPAGGKILKS